MRRKSVDVGLISSLITAPAGATDLLSLEVTVAKGVGALGFGMKHQPGGQPSALTIGTVAAGGPAEQAGLQCGDYIISVDGQNLTTASRADATAALRATGPAVQVAIARTVHTPHSSVTAAHSATGSPADSSPMVLSPAPLARAPSSQRFETPEPEASAGPISSPACEYLDRLLTKLRSTVAQHTARSCAGFKAEFAGLQHVGAANAAVASSKKVH